MVDYVLTVAVSVSAGVQNAAAALVFLRGYEPIAATALIGLLTLMNLRGVRESGRALAVPVYAFLGAMALMIVVGLLQWVTGNLDDAESAAYEVLPAPGYEAITTFGLAILLLRAFASGTVALTGVQGVANGVPALQRPKSANAARILLIMATISVSILLTVILLVRASGIQIAADPEVQLRVGGQPVGEDFVQETVLGQLSQVVFGPASFGVLLVAVATGIMLVVAANTAFNGFPQLTSRLAGDGFLPSNMLSRGLRLTYSNGILLLAAFSVVLVLIYQATVTELIQMYIVGVFISFTISQLGMVRHWNRQLRTEVSLARRRAMQRSRLINIVGSTVSATVLTVVILTRFTEGAGLSLLGIALLWMVMTMVYRLHREIADETALPDDATAHQDAVPSRVFALVYVERVDRPAMRALAYARAARPQVLEAVTVDISPERTQELRRAWESRDIPVTLRFLESPYRETGRPVVDYVRRLHRDRPRDIVVVYLPEYVSNGFMVRWFRDRALDQLRDALLRTPGVVVASVPWQGSSVEEAAEPDAPPAEPDAPPAEPTETTAEPTRAE